MSRYRFALKPMWILSHLVVLVLVASMLGAMSWQISRLHQKQARNATVAARTDEPEVAVTSLVAPGQYERADGFEFRRVTAAGTYQADQQVLVRSRSRDGAPGSWVLTPLVLPDGDAVIVNRGWIPNSGQFHAVPARYRPPRGTVTVTGLARRTERRGSFGSRDPGSGKLTDLARADLRRLDAQLREDLLPIYIQLQDQDPAVRATDPAPVPMPTLDEGPHLSYAVQWAIFSTIAIVGYALILRRKAGEIERAETPQPEASA